MLAAPEGNFAAELARIDLGRSRIQAIVPAGTQGYFTQSSEGELADLREALRRMETPTAEIEKTCSAHQRQRELLGEYVNWQPGRAPTTIERLSIVKSIPGPSFPKLEVVGGLPAEFGDYFEGLTAWHNPFVKDKALARSAWERLLARPESERRFKSTWAAFMLGKSWKETEPERALQYFKQVRDLAGHGCRDSVGLAAASLGLEARIHLDREEYAGAFELYLAQLASGDPTATNSLAVVAAKVLANNANALVSLAKNSRYQKVITAYIISRSRDDSIYHPGSVADDNSHTNLQVWLRAVEAAGISDLDSAEAFALAAYRANQMDAAQRWIKRAPNSPLAQWLQAKLWERAGRLQAAAETLARITPRFPVLREKTNAPAAKPERIETLTIASESPSYSVTAEQQIRGELGVLRLARQEYIQSLDLLLTSGFWMDAAYVAERVLTTDELKSYVDRFWPPVTEDQVAAERERYGDSAVCPAIIRGNVRYLLARRLTRELRGDLAREYYPAEWVGPFDLLAEKLRRGWDESVPAAERADAMLVAALITRTNGMELIATELAPDWHYHEGQFECGVTVEERSTNHLAVRVRPSADELRRANRPVADPDLRFHYRYQAAELAWEAAKLLPNDNDRTAYILWQGGTFLKNIDPVAADRFYKALVRRNRKTVLGAEADRQRWFPTIRADGTMAPRRSKSQANEQAP